MLGAPAVIAFEQVGDTDHHIKGGVVVAALGKGAAMQGFAQVEEIQFREPVALLKGSKGMELLAGKQASSGAGLLLVEQGANQGEGSVEDGEQGKRCKALKGSDSTELKGSILKNGIKLRKFVAKFIIRGIDITHEIFSH